MRIVLIAVLSLCLVFAGTAFVFAEDQATDNQATQVIEPEAGIPNYTQVEDGNGRPQQMDTDDRTAEELNSVERTIIMRDTIISNRELIRQ